MASTAWRCVEAVRARTPVAVLPPAKDVPSQGWLRGEPFGSISRALQLDDPSITAACALADPVRRERLLRGVHPSLTALPVRWSLTDDPGAIAVVGAAQPHDTYFRVVRTHDDPNEAYARALLQGLAIWLSELDAGAPDADAQVIGTALCTLWTLAVGGATEALVPPPAQATDRTSPLRRPEHAVRRWLRAHQIFAVITQGLIWVLRRFASAMDDGDPPACRAWMGHIARLYDASAAAFRFATDYDGAHYRDTIRPSMEAPRAPAGFSGAMSVDHAQLVARLAALRTQLAVAAERFPDESGAMKQALTRLYDDHKRVCARMAGEDSPSLRSAQLTAQPPASEILHRFFLRRLTMLEGAAPASTISPKSTA